MKKSIVPCITGHGFQRTGNSAFSLISEDLAAFVHVEHVGCRSRMWSSNKKAIAFELMRYIGGFNGFRPTLPIENYECLTK